VRLYIVRHGIALDVGEAGIRCDFDRPLSDRGRVKTRAVAQGLHAAGVRPDRIGSSPLPRAWQTAEIMVDTLSPAEPLHRCPFMEPGSDLDAMLDWCTATTAASAMLVGHMPDVAWMTLACLPPAERQSLHFKKAAVACIVFDKKVALGEGRLEWHRQPREWPALPAK
jgi:phosphohistidine phosphatase